MISTAIGKLIDKFPGWGKAAVYALAAVGCVYYISRYGFFQFLLRMIFSP